MSKNITIQEGGVARNFGNVSKLQTALMGGGSCYWVPEDETQLKTKHITANGTYKAASDEAYGYSKVTVNVRGGNGSADSHGKPNTSGDIKPGGSGSAVVGTNPETGNEEVVGVDEGGNLVTTPIPSAIEIITPPAKTEYTEGETMDYNGIIVGLKKKDGTTFTDATYPNGHIPMGELIFPVEVAPEGSTGRKAASDIVSSDYPVATSVRNEIVFTGTAEVWNAYGNGVDVVSDAVATSYRYGDEPDNVMTVIASKSKKLIYDRIGCNQTGYYVIQRVNGNGSSYTHNGMTVYYYTESCGIGSHQAGRTTTHTFIPGSGIESSDNAREVAWTLIYGELSGGTEDIPVQWKSPYDGREFEDTFEITVTDGTGTTVDDEGFSGGGGTF